MEEIWKDIEGYEGKYQVSNTGEVKSLNYRGSGKTKLLRQTADANEYFGKDRKSSNMYMCLSGKNKNAYGYIFRYAEEKE